MFNSLRADGYLDVAWQEEALEIDILEDGESRGVAVAPGLNALSDERKGVAAFSGRPTTPKTSNPVDHEYASAEYNRLIRRREDFSSSPEFFHRLASLAKRSSRFREAVQHAKQAADLTGSSFFKYKLASALLDADDVAGSVEILNALAHEESDVPSSLRLAELRIADNDIQGAVEYVRIALKQDVLDWRSNMLAGAVALCQSAFEVAVRYFRVALDERPNSAILYFNLAFAHYWLGNESTAVKIARRAVALNPFDRKLQLFFADLTIKGKRKKELSLARLYIELFLKVDCDDNVIGRLTHLARETKEQKAIIKVLDKLPPECNSPSVKNNLGVLYADIGQKRKAQILFRNAALATDWKLQSADRLLAAANLANAMLEDGKYEAVEDITKSLLEPYQISEVVSDEGIARLLAARVQSLYYQEKIHQAEAIYKDLIHFRGIQPRLDFVTGTLKVWYESTVTGEFNDALNFAELALNAANRVRLNRGQFMNVALNNYVYILLELDRLDEAEKLVGSLRTDMANSEYIFATKGLLSIKSGKFTRGETLYRRAASLVTSKSIKSALLKKMNYELAKALLDADPAEALRYARAAGKIKHAKHRLPTRYLDSKVKELLAGLEQRRY